MSEDDGRDAVQRQVDNLAEVLRLRCRELGLKTTGSPDVLCERLENHKEAEELRRLLEEEKVKHDPRKRKPVDEQDQAILDAQLLSSVKEGTLIDVQDAIAKGARLDASCFAHKNTALIKACSRTDDLEVAAEIVQMLLDHRASVHHPSPCG